ncbi:helix-turn-helix domain-containing protein [Paenibacillus sp. SZ31]|uniref:helix-turn-helix domain-containing protein n=1 Tax=Paenibacillus sp. SZ31 TaxID=2725555 RepID=UPI00146DE3E6|nr:helix-turn-helix domain-containing protein [Paenibacillus sp. SZ31]NMI03549.1 helix-turn-helix domain-containing protein [Paenibacillus sp. SZ31]
MKLVNPWENIAIQQIRPGSSIHNFDGKVHILYVLKGSIEVESEEESIKVESPGFYILPRSESFHLTSPQTLSYDIALYYNYDKNQGDNGYQYEFRGDSRKGGNGSDEEMNHLANKLLSGFYLEKSSISDVEVFNLYFSMLSLLERKYYKEVPIRSNKSMRSRIEEIKFYLGNNFEKDIKLKDIAKKFFVSEQYLSRTFSEIVGQSLSDYLLEHRMRNVERQLVETNDPVTSIGYEAGFTNINSFNRLFKKRHGISPSTFRKTKTSIQVHQSIETQECDQKELEAVLQHVNQEKKRKIRIEAQNSEKIRLSSAILNVGQASKLLVTELNDQLAAFEKHNIFEFSRVSGLLNRSMFRVDGNTPDYALVVKAIGKLVARGWKPFIVLNPPEAAEVVTSVGHNHRTYSWENWLKEIQELFRLLLNHYGKSVMAQWKIEVVRSSPWYYEMGVNHGSNRFKGKLRNYDLSLDEDFVKYYDEVRKVLKKVEPGLQVGIGGIVLEVKEMHRDGFVAQLVQEGMEPDFCGISALPYSKKNSTSNGKSAIVKSTKENYILMMTQSLFTYLEDYLNVPDLYLTEFNITSSSRDQLNDMAFKGLYILHHHLGLSDFYKGIGYWLMSDLAYSNETAAETIEFSGGPGLLTVSGIPKIGFYAYEFLNKLGKTLLYRDSSLFITKNEDENITILAYLYAPVDPSYFSSFEKYDMNSNKLIFHNPVSKNMILQLSNLPADCRNYRAIVKKMSFNDGNALDEALKMTSLNSFDMETIDYLKVRSIPVTYMRHIHTRGGTLEMDIKIEPQQILCITLERMY